ncbi:MAG: serine hydrolase domain-containing protein [Ilumatobacteraceae bacterium]
MRRRAPALVATSLVGVALAVASANAGGVATTAQFGSYLVVEPDDGDVAIVPTTTTTTIVRSDRTVPETETVLTVPLPGSVAGFDGAAFSAAIADPLLRRGALAVGIAVAKDGHLIWASGDGTANRFGEPVTTEHRFRIASNSKMITSGTVLTLVQAGLVGLDEPVLQRIADQFGIELGDDRMRDVTVRQLLSHTSGFDDFKAEFFREQAVSCEDVTVEALQGRLIGTPGLVANYSNENFACSDCSSSI